jgi:putative transposase
MWGSGAKNPEPEMKRKRHSTEEIIRILRNADGKKTVEEVCREANISEQTFYRWRRKYGRMEMADAKRFKELENENSELKKMLADEMLKSRVLEETLKKKWWAPPRSGRRCEGWSRTECARCARHAVTSAFTVQAANVMSIQDSPTAKIDLSFSAPASGDYSIWGRVRAPDSFRDSFFVSMDGGEESIYHIYGSPTPDPGSYTPGWIWTRIDEVAGTALTFSLDSGNHVLTFRNREQGTQLDSVLLIYDPSQPTPPGVPESGSTLAMLGLVAAGLMGVRRRRA